MRLSELLCCAVYVTVKGRSYRPVRAQVQVDRAFCSFSSSCKKISASAQLKIKNTKISSELLIFHEVKKDELRFLV